MSDEKPEPEGPMMTFAPTPGCLHCALLVTIACHAANGPVMVDEVVGQLNDVIADLLSRAPDPADADRIAAAVGPDVARKLSAHRAHHAARREARAPVGATLQ